MGFDYVLLGGGLANALIALALRARRPRARLAMIERDSRLGGNHTWSFHEGEVAPRSRTWLDPIVACRWPRTQVAFPAFRRTLDGGYASSTSERLDLEVRRTLEEGAGSTLYLEAEARTVTAHQVVLADGRTLEGRLVVDARGPDPFAFARGAGYQKFLGLELSLAGPAPVAHPLLMDATVDQIDGYRFVYVLPFREDRVLVEDTYYSDHPTLDAAALRARVLAYAQGHGLRVREVLREETGVLPIPWASAPEPPPSGALRAGYAGGLFHPTTGYSLPMAVRLAEHVASREPEDVWGPALRALLDKHAVQARFCRLLNWLLFCAYPPAERYRVLERFYRLPEATIGRFYAMQLTLADRARLLLGRPPGGLSLRSAWRRLPAA